MNARPYQLEVIRVPMQGGGAGVTVQAVCKHPGVGCPPYEGDTWQHRHTWPATAEGEDAAVAFAVKVQMECGQGWSPAPPVWILAGCIEEQGRAPTAADWATWRAATGRR